MTRHGTWQETGGGGGGSPAGLVVLVLAAVALSGVAAGIAQAVASLVVVLVLAAAVAAVLAVAGLAAVLVFRARRKASGREPRISLIPAPMMHERAIPARERPALEAPKPQVVNNFFGLTPDQVAEIIRAGISRPGSVPTTSDQDTAGRWTR